MNKQQNDFKPYHLRSVGAVIRDGYLLYMDQFRRIFRGTWLVALCYALISGVASSMMVTTISQIFFLRSLGMSPWSPVAILIGTIVVMSLAVCLLYASGFSLLHSHLTEDAIPTEIRWFGFMKRKTTIRTFMAWLCLMLIWTFAILLTGMLFHFMQQYLSTVAFYVLTGLTMLVLVLATPLPMMMMVHYILSDSKYPFAQKLPLRHWGNTILVALVVFIITQALAFVTELPTNILTIANLQSQMGSLKGDPLGMPDYITWVNIIAFSLAGFIKAYVLLSVIFPLYYLNGSIAAQEKEREEMAQRFKNL